MKTPVAAWFKLEKEKKNKTGSNASKETAKSTLKTEYKLIGTHAKLFAFYMRHDLTSDRENIKRAT